MADDKMPNLDLDVPGREGETRASKMGEQLVAMYPHLAGVGHLPSATDQQDESESSTADREAAPLKERSSSPGFVVMGIG